MEPLKASNVNNDLPIQGGNVNEVQGPIQKLPPEILKVIFSQLENLDPQQIGVVSKLWNVEVLNAVKDEEFKLLESFVTALINILELIAKNPDSYEGLGLDRDDLAELIQWDPECISIEAERAKQIEVVTQGLAKILKNTKITQPFDLLKIKTSLMNLKNEINDLLIRLDLDIIYILSRILKNEKSPETWKLEVFSINGKNEMKLIELSSILKRTEMESDDGQLIFYTNLLCNWGYVDRAIDLTKKISNEKNQSAALESILTDLTNNHHFDKAAKVAIENPFNHESLQKVILVFANHGKVDLAIKVCDSIKDVKLRDLILFSISFIALQKDDYEGVTKLYALINDDQLRSNIIRIILQNDPDFLKRLQKSKLDGI